LATTGLAETGPEALRLAPRSAVLPRFETLRTAVDQERGIREQFLLPVIGGRTTVAVLSTPTDARPSAGWVICHSLGSEHVHLQPLEVEAARSLTEAGFAVLRFHTQGYGDSEGATEAVSLASHLRDAIDATGVLASEADISDIGLIGGSFGGAVAALAADRVAASRLVMWQPVVAGARFIHQFVRAGLVTELASRGGRLSDGDDPFAGLEPDTALDVQGFPLRKAVYEEIASLDLLRELKSFSGKSLVVQLSSSPPRRPTFERLVALLRSLGGESTLQVVVDRQVGLFGHPRYQSGSGKKEDTQADLSERLIRTTLAWCRGMVGNAPGAGPRGQS
jgi:alpha/beta superfamily hydrolase